MYTAYTAGFQNEKEQNRHKTATLSYYAEGSITYYKSFPCCLGETQLDKYR